MSEEPFLTVITPTIGRATLADTVTSVAPSEHRVEHVIIFDGMRPQEVHPPCGGVEQRVYWTSSRYGDFGHSLRGLGWNVARGRYILYIDDDDLYLPRALDVIGKRLAEEEPIFLLFPAERQGVLWLAEPPRLGRTLSCQYAHRKWDAEGRPVRFTSGPYGHDGEWVEDMFQRYEWGVLRGPALVRSDLISRGA